MNIQQGVGIVVLVVSVIILLIALFLWLQSRRRTPSAEDDHDRIYRLRSVYFFVLSVAAAAILGATLQGLPYSDPDPHSGKPLVVKVTGRQWLWTFDRVKGPNTESKSINSLKLPFGKRVEFRVTSADVNHDFAIYSAAGHLLTQTQAMPGYVNKLYFRFPEPGKYRILCLEYCGVGHQAMNATIEVTRTSAQASTPQPAARSLAAIHPVADHPSEGVHHE